MSGECNVTEVGTGRTLKDVVGEILIDEEPTIGENAITAFTSELANNWALYFLEDREDVEWEYTEHNDDECMDWLVNELLDREIVNDEEVAEACAEDILNASLTFCTGRMSEAIRRLAGV
jgi:hypothetical protein